MQALESEVKETAVSQAPSDAGNWVTCSEFQLDIDTHQGRSFRFRAFQDAQEYRLFADTQKEQTDKLPLMRAILAKIAGNWKPDDWQVQADKNGNITGVR